MLTLITLTVCSAIVPLYALGDKCGGNFSYLPNGCKDCSNCLFPHLRENYDAINERYQDILSLIKQNDNSSKTTDDN